MTKATVNPLLLLVLWAWSSMAGIASVGDRYDVALEQSNLNSNAPVIGFQLNVDNGFIESLDYIPSNCTISIHNFQWTAPKAGGIRNVHWMTTLQAPAF